LPTTCLGWAAVACAREDMVVLRGGNGPYRRPATAAPPLDASIAARRRAWTTPLVMLRSVRHICGSTTSPGIHIRTRGRRGPPCSSYRLTSRAPDDPNTLHVVQDRTRGLALGGGRLPLLPLAQGGRSEGEPHCGARPSPEVPSGRIHRYVDVFASPRRSRKRHRLHHWRASGRLGSDPASTTRATGAPPRVPRRGPRPVTLSFRDEQYPLSAGGTPHRGARVATAAHRPRYPTLARHAPRRRPPGPDVLRRHVPVPGRRRGRGESRAARHSLPPAPPRRAPARPCTPRTPAPPRTPPPPGPPLAAGYGPVCQEEEARPPRDVHPANSGRPGRARAGQGPPRGEPGGGAADAALRALRWHPRQR